MIDLRRVVRSPRQLDGWLTSGDSKLVPSDDPATARALLATTDDPLAERYLTFIQQHPDAFHRTCRPGHLTGSALVLEHGCQRTLLMLHAKLNRWLQPGGHADGNTNLASVALREATEETGIEGLRIHPRPVHLDIHRVAPPAEDPHLHYDVRFVAQAPPDARPRANAESRELRWVSLNELATLGCDPGLLRLADLALATARAVAARAVAARAAPDPDR